jgi:hypothetical protein
MHPCHGPFVISVCGLRRCLSEGVRGECAQRFKHGVDQLLELCSLVRVHDVDGVTEGLLVEPVQERFEEPV